MVAVQHNPCGFLGQGTNTSYASRPPRLLVTVRDAVERRWSTNFDNWGFLQGKYRVLVLQKGDFEGGGGWAKMTEASSLLAGCACLLQGPSAGCLCCIQPTIYSPRLSCARIAVSHEPASGGEIGTPSDHISPTWNTNWVGLGWHLHCEREMVTHLATKWVGN
jgi:hypothetical protein